MRRSFLFQWYRYADVFARENSATIEGALHEQSNTTRIRISRRKTCLFEDTSVHVRTLPKRRHPYPRRRSLRLHFFRFCLLLGTEQLRPGAEPESEGILQARPGFHQDAIRNRGVQHVRIRSMSRCNFGNPFVFCRIHARGLIVMDISSKRNLGTPCKTNFSL